MLLELMSNGTLAELPPENKPEGITVSDENSVMLLLPHNKYLLGTDGGQWIYASSRPDEQPQGVYLYEDQVLSLLNEGTTPTIIPADTVNFLRRELFSLSEPPGHHAPTVLMLKTFMRDNSVFDDEKNFLDEEIFSSFMKNDEILYKAYWTLRFSLSRSELETAGRLKAWLKAGPAVFEDPKHEMKIWFSLLKLPDADAVNELVELSFSKLELNHISQQFASPLVVYNPASGWLIVGQFGRKINVIFKAWLYLNHELYHELRNVRKMTVHDIILAVWGEHETRQAMTERAKYKGAEKINLP
ncbi:MAG: hypothetical protein SPL10_00375 [Synergistales bacterium]|nr:hypothetical protein [Synergistales bacterium]MDY6400746.1 hypothetical protein [Synergistales bacterium]MDY6404578.1 hypothetical protein [Synergistales bacterium]MDY6411204.1 hypothetical protein [Synergistales bacterium]MDY6413598.1 hypothetical protein [Synergistales bacterium]